MHVVINIPKEFERDWNETKFTDCIHRAMCDLRDYPNHDKMTGNYEMETLEMLRNAFENGTPLKGHGKLKDIDKIEALLDLEDPDNAIAKALKNIIESVPTIVEADECTCKESKVMTFEDKAKIIISQLREDRDKLQNIINQIKTEIEDTGAYEQEVHGKTEFLRGINYCLSILDKYKEEKEESEEYECR